MTDYLTLNDVAKELRLSKSTVERLVRAGRSLRNIVDEPFRRKVPWSLKP